MKLANLIVAGLITGMAACGPDIVKYGPGQQAAANADGGTTLLEHPCSADVDCDAKTTGLACETPTLGNFEGAVCVPSCKGNPAACVPYGLVCNQAAGLNGEANESRCRRDCTTTGICPKDMQCLSRGASRFCFPVPCGANNSCPTGMTCDTRAGICRSSSTSSNPPPPPQCTTNADCATGQQCVNATCQNTGACTTNCPDGTACTTGTTCATGQCINGICGCNSNSQCAAGQTCTNARCTGSSNSCSNVTCGNGQTCVNGACVAQGTGGPGSTCSKGSDCFSGVCMSNGTCQIPKFTIRILAGATATLLHFNEAGNRITPSNGLSSETVTGQADRDSDPTQDEAAIPATGTDVAHCQVRTVFTNGAFVPCKIVFQGGSPTATWNAPN